MAAPEDLMEEYERAFRHVEPRLQRWLSLFLFGKKIELRGAQNLVPQGPNIIIGNHCGSYKDIAVLLRIKPRMLYFTANQRLFTKEGMDGLVLKHLRRHLRDFGPMLNSMLGPVKSRLIDFVSANITRVGTIPVALEASKRGAMSLCEEYLRRGRAIVTLQGRGRVHADAPHPYINRFKRGPAILSYVLYNEDGIAVPVTPLAMFGTHWPWVTPGTIKVNVGGSMTIVPYLSSDPDASIDSFRDALEERVKALFLELIRA
jgi:1-acyl-sn-glycerol-3-phosphate acyltransferase